MSLIPSVKEKALEVVKGFLAKGADVNGVDYEGRTALYWAARDWSGEIVTALIDAKADVNKAENNGKTPLHEASYFGRVECVRPLIKHKANVNALTKNGYSPLHYASLAGSLACVQILVAADALCERDRCNKYGETPLTLAIRGNHPNIAEFLLHSGVKMKNVTSVVALPIWMTEIIAERQLIMSVILALKGVLKWRLGIYKDVTHLIALYVWRIRLNYK